MLDHGGPIADRRIGGHPVAGGRIAAGRRLPRQTPGNLAAHVTVCRGQAIEAAVLNHDSARHQASARMGRKVILELRAPAVGF